MTPRGRGARANRNRRLRDRRDVNRSVASHFPRFTQRRLVVEDSFNLWDVGPRLRASVTETDYCFRRRKLGNYDNAQTERDRQSAPMTDATMPSTPPRDAEDGFDEREMVVASLIRELGSLSPSGRFRDKRLIHRFAATRDYNRDATAKLLHEYARYRRARGLEDDSLRNNPGVSREMRKRHTMRLLDPRLGPATSDSAQRLTFLQLHTPSMWPTARDKDGCPVVYTNVEQYACRGASSRAVEQTFVWILETVCNELDEEEGLGDHRGRFTILLDLTRCPHVHLPAFCKLGEILQRALKRGFRGRLNRFYIYPTGRRGRVLLRVIKPFLGKYTPPKIEMIPRENLDRLTEIFPREILPEHLGGTSRLLTVAFADPSPSRSVEGAEAGAAAAADATKTTTTTRETPRETEGDHGDLRWFLKVPLVNFSVLAVMTACSARFGASFPAREERRRRRRLTWARRAAPALRNAVAWHLVGFTGFGIQYSGAWSAAVTVLFAAWRYRKMEGAG